MRIVHAVTVLSEDGAYGGPASVAVQQCLGLRRRGHEVLLVGGWEGKPPPPRTFQGIPALLRPLWQLAPRYRFAGRFNPLFQAQLLRLMRGPSRPDVVHVHFSRDLVMLGVAQAARWAGVPYLAQTHGAVVPDPRAIVQILDRLMVLRLLRRASKVLTLNDKEERSLRDLLGGDLPLTRLANGVTVPHEAPRAPRAGDPPEVLFCARLHPVKRVGAFAEMAVRLLSQGVNANFTVVGPDQGDLPALLSAWGPEPRDPRLRYEGALAPGAVPNRFAQADIHVLPSREDAFPMGLLEALSLGLPSVISDSIEIADELSRRDAVVVTDGSPQALAEAVRPLVENPQLRAGLGRRGWAAARELYDVEKVLDTVEEFYRQAASAGPGPEDRVPHQRRRSGRQTGVRR